MVRYRAASADYFRMLGVQIVRGRDFRASDADSTVVIVNDVMARELWPDESPIGKQISIVTGLKQVVWREVIGVMPDMRDRGLVSEKRPQIVELNSVPEASPRLLSRTSAAPRPFEPPLHHTIALA